MIVLLSEMKNYKNWVAYRLEANSEGRLTKVPYNPVTGRGAMANNPETWSSYDESVNFAKKKRENFRRSVWSRLGHRF